MPINKKAYIRYLTLDKCFKDRNHRYYMDDLIAKCEEALRENDIYTGVSRRQVFEDIKFMENEYGWRIKLERKRDGKKVYYRYEDPGFSINTQPLTDEESQQIKTLIMALRRYRGLPNNEWMEEVISNLEYRFNIGGYKESIIGFEQNQGLKGLNFLSKTIDATSNHQPLRIEYHNYRNGGRDMTFILHPYYLKQYNSRWFLFGLDDDKDRITTVALDRIVSMKPIDTIRFIPNKTIDFDLYFDDVIGVTIPSDVATVDIRLRFTKSRFMYVTSKPLHPSQQVIDDDDCIVEIKVKPNFELEQQILAFGPDVEVLSPEPFRRQIIMKIRKSLEMYGHGDG